MNEFLVMMMALPLTALIGGLIIGALALHHRARLRELAYRERIAMIERGLVPTSETSPAPPDPAVGEPFDARLRSAFAAPGERAIRHRTAGVVLIAIGLGLLMIISFAGESPSAGIGVGGAIMIVGAASLLNSFFVAQDEARRDLEERRRAAAAPPREGPPSADSAGE